MADFIELEAEGSEEEKELEPHERKKLKRAKQMEDSSEEKEDDDEDKIREELKDLIDDNPIKESEGEDLDASGGQKRKKSDDEEYDDQLEDEDYDLIEENLGVKVERKKRCKRLRKIHDEKSDNEEAADESQDRDAIAAEKFLDDDDERRSERSHQPVIEPEQFGEEEDEGEYSDADDFIVNDEGKPVGGRRRRKPPIFTGKKAEVTANNTRRPAFKDVGNDVAKATVSIQNREKDVVVAAAAAAATVKPQDVNVNVRDIDASREPLLGSKYAKDIYKYLLKQEEKYAIKEGYLASHRSTPKMRFILIDWIFKVHEQYTQLTLETLHATVAIIDTYLQKNKTVGEDSLKLVGVSALMIACKYKDNDVLDVSDFVDICEKAYTKKQILHTAWDIMKELDFILGRLLGLEFLRLYIEEAESSA